MARVKSSNSHRRLRPYEAIYNRMANGARRRGLECEISYDDFLIFTAVPRCHYCWHPVEWIKFHTNAYGARYNLDRMDNSKGYIKDNLVVCCGPCNRGKYGEFTHLQWYERTAPYRRKESLLWQKV